MLACPHVKSRTICRHDVRARASNFGLLNVDVCLHDVALHVVFGSLNHGGVLRHFSRISCFRLKPLWSRVFLSGFVRFASFLLCSLSLYNKWFRAGSRTF